MIYRIIDLPSNESNKINQINSSFHFNFMEDENRLNSIKDCRTQTEIIYSH